jgi:hypothetical protein
MEEGILIRAVRAGFDFDPDGINLFGIDRGTRIRKTRYIEPVTWKEKKERFQTLEPFLRLEKHNAQKLIDDLWDCGLRPSEGSGSAGALKKTENHLSDMRKIVFHKLGIKND